MKKYRLILVCACLFGLWSAAMAQNRGNDGRPQLSMEERLERRAVRMADEFGLKDETRVKFMASYKAYMQQMMRHRVAETQMEGENRKKPADYTDEEAKARVQVEFDRKAQSIVDAYNRLDVEKKYYEEFSTYLNPKQLMRIFVPVRGPRDGMSRNGFRQGNRFPGGQQRAFGGGGHESGFDGGMDDGF